MKTYEKRRRRDRWQKLTNALNSTRELRKLTEQKAKLLEELERALVRERSTL